ncbi:MAG TPA: TetR family transcriptional regulator [Novosphingobium sp.]|nr:TetR family transcriptional regulator [Novosphingobium sp.]HMP55337.1 TetR family transcriptional regulator [Novosphingobium sp.]
MTVSPPVRRKRRSPQDLREAILAAAAAEFEANGFAGATTAAIARRAETTEAQIFRLFASKAELFRASVFAPLNRHFAQFHARALGETSQPASQRDLATRYIDELQDFIEDHSRSLMSLIVARAHGQVAGEGPEEIEGLEAYFARGSATMRAHRGENLAVPPELLVRVSFAAVLGSVLFRDWLFPPGLADDAAIRRAIAAFTIDGIGTGDPAGG